MNGHILSQVMNFSILTYLLFLAVSVAEELPVAVPIRRAAERESPIVIATAYNPLQTAVADPLDELEAETVNSMEDDDSQVGAPPTGLPYHNSTLVILGFSWLVLLLVYTIIIIVRAARG